MTVEMTGRAMTMLTGGRAGLAGQGRLLAVAGVAIAAAFALVIEYAREPRLRPAPVPSRLVHEATLGPVERPAGVAVGPEGTIYVVDADSRQVASFTRDGVRARSLGLSSEDGAGTLGQLANPLGVAVDQQGNVYVSDLEDGSITVFRGGRAIAQFGSTVLSELRAKAGALAATADGLLVCDLAGHRVLKVAWDGTLLTVYAGPPDDPLSYPNGAWAAEDGRVYVADTNHDRVVAFESNGHFARTVVRGLTNPRGLMGDTRGRLYVAATLADTVFVIDVNSGAVLDRIMAVRGQALSFPTSVAVDGDRLMVADRAASGLHIWRIQGGGGGAS